MIQVTLFIGGIRPLPDSGRPTGMYKTRVSTPSNWDRTALSAIFKPTDAYMVVRKKRFTSTRQNITPGSQNAFRMLRHNW